MTPPRGSDDTGILLDIYERLGAIETHLKFGTETHKELKQSVDTIDYRTDVIETDIDKIKLIVSDVTALKTDVADLKMFRGRIGAMVGVGTAIMMGAFYLIWEGIKFFSSDVRAMFSRLWH